MNRVFCDKCGKEISGKEIHHLKIVERTGSEKIFLTTGYDITIDLCESCTRAIVSEDTAYRWRKEYDARMEERARKKSAREECMRNA